MSPKSSIKDKSYATVLYIKELARSSCIIYWIILNNNHISNDSDNMKHLFPDTTLLLIAH